MTPSSVVTRRVFPGQADLGFLAALASLVLLQRRSCLLAHDAIERSGIESGVT